MDSGWNHIDGRVIFQVFVVYRCGNHHGKRSGDQDHGLDIDLLDYASHSSGKEPLAGGDCGKLMSKGIFGHDEIYEMTHSFAELKLTLTYAGVV